MISDAGPATIGGRATHALLLKPKSSTEPFSQAKVWIDNADGTLRQFETVEPSGITRLVTITAVTPNATVDQKSFTFKPPKGARIVDQTVLGGRVRIGVSRLEFHYSNAASGETTSGADLPLAALE